MSRDSHTPIVFEGLQAGLRMFRWVMLLLLVLFGVPILKVLRRFQQRFNFLVVAEPTMKWPSTNGMNE